MIILYIYADKCCYDKLQFYPVAGDPIMSQFFFQDQNNKH